MSDLISRQAAIDAIEHRLAEPAYQHEGEDWYTGMNCAESELYDLPPAQPEIIRCKDCKFYSPMNRETKTGICNLIMHQNFGDNWFCAGAERRPDESDRKRRCPMADGMQKEEQDERYYQQTGGD